MGAVLKEIERIDAGVHPVILGRHALKALEERLLSSGNGSINIILCDDNTVNQCLPELQHAIPSLLDAEILHVPAGEDSKSISCSQYLWSELAQRSADRNTTLICLGGGVITDLGGFVASTYKRGIRTIHLPTTLMGMVDAAIGGKTAIDLAGVKNVVGTFHAPEAVHVHVPFLRTLGKRQLLNGVAEMLKHALVNDPGHWRALLTAPLHDLSALASLIEASVRIKARVVKSDPHEKGERKLLNFGHTIGHGIEAYSWEGPQRALLHGEAVAAGMICEAWLSWRLGLLDRESYDRINAHLFELYRPYPLDSTAHHRILELMRNDKKNKEGQFRFSLLKAIGEGVVDVRVPPAQVQAALEHYRGVVQMMPNTEDRSE